MSNKIVQGLWIGGPLSNVEKLCINSFLKNGHDFHLYCYDFIEGVPTGTTIKDGREILSGKDIFYYQDGTNSVSGFSNLFRYKLLYEKGGWWSDMDCILLKPLDFEQEYVFCNQDEKLINCALVKAPKGNDMTKLCYEQSLKKDKTAIIWGEIGPDLFTKVIEELALKHLALPNYYFYPIKPWFFKQNAEIFVDPKLVIGIMDEIYCIHLYTECWRRIGLDKNAKYEKESLYEQLKIKYL